MGDISDLIEAYIERPVEKLILPFEDDKWGLSDILRSSDRRIGKRRLKEMLDATEDNRLHEIIMKRIL